MKLDYRVSEERRKDLFRQAEQRRLQKQISADQPTASLLNATRNQFGKALVTIGQRLQDDHPTWQNAPESV